MATTFDLDSPEHEICRGVMADLKAEARRLRASLEAAEKRAGVAEAGWADAIKRWTKMASDNAARVAELEKALGEACDLVEAWNRSANSMEKPPASTRAKLARLRSLLRGAKPACGTCGGSGIISTPQTHDHGRPIGVPGQAIANRIDPCPACSASPGAGEKGR